MSYLYGQWQFLRHGCIFHANVIFSQLNRVLQQQMFTSDIDDIAQNANSHKVIKYEKQRADENRHIAHAIIIQL